MTDDQTKMWEWAEERGGLVEADGVREHTFRYRRHLQAPDRFAWDAWEQRAKSAGVVAELAQLGRSLMREADQHAWSEELQAECGWSDDGGAMIALALDKPETARARWSWLLDTDGGQIDPETLEPFESAEIGGCSCGAKFYSYDAVAQHEYECPLADEGTHPLDNERQHAGRDERQRTWSRWLDEAAPALEFDYDDDRDRMAVLVAEVVAEVPAGYEVDASGGGPRADERARCRGWRDWIERVAPRTLDLRSAADRERLAALFVDAVPSVPRRGSWAGWVLVAPRAPISACVDDELRARVDAVAETLSRPARMVLRYLTRNAIDLVREGVARCADSVVAFAGMFKTAETAAVLVPTIAARLGVPDEALCSFLEYTYSEHERAIERALDPHVDCSIHDGDNCGGADCPPAIALRARAAQKQGAWSRLELRRDGGGHRHYLDGEPVHCGTQLELQATADRSDEYGEYEVPLPEGVTVRYEASLNADEVSVTLHKYVGNHEFVTRHHAGMRFRWPGRTN